MRLDGQRLRFHDAMANLLAAVNIITAEGDAGQCGIAMATICSVTDTPPPLMMYINANSAMNPVFQGDDELCVNVPNHEQELMTRHFAGMTSMAMEERSSLSCWQKGPLAQPVLKDSLASLEGGIHDMQTIDTHLVYLVEIKSTILSAEGHELIYFKRCFRPMILEMGAATWTPAPSRIRRRGIFIVISITYPPSE